jgi:hypothetical protein
VITSEDFILWKNEPITQAFYEACQERVEEAKEQLAVTAGTDIEMNNFLRGFIHAYREMTEFRVEDVE